LLAATYICLYYIFIICSKWNLCYINRVRRVYNAASMLLS
jgi:hypothetical protein